MPEATPEQAADALVSLADKAFATFGESLKGVGGTVSNDFASLAAAARSMARAGTSGAEAARRIRADEMLSADIKASKLAQVDSLVNEANDSTKRVVLAGLDRIEAQLMAAIRPAPNSDMRSLLVRQELDAHVQVALANRQSVAEVFIRLADNPEYASEILGGWGQSKMMAAKEPFRVMERAVVAKLVRLPGGTPQQQAAKAALKITYDPETMKTATAIDRLVGHAGGFLFAAKQRIDATKPVVNRGHVSNYVHLAPEPRGKR
jgi:hypothetical protein